MLNEEECNDVWPARLPSSPRRSQGLADVHTESGRVADVQPQPRRRASFSAAGERHTIPPRRTAARVAAIPAANTPRIYIDPESTRPRETDAYRPARPEAEKRFRWLWLTGVVLLVMIFGWVALSALGTWWQTTQDDWHYGR